MFSPFPAAGYRLLKGRSKYVLLETSKYDRDNYRTRLFIDPVAVFKAYDPGDLPDLFSRIERFTGAGYYAAGYFHYECGLHFEPVVPFTATCQPIAWIGIYQEPALYSHRTGDFANLDWEAAGQDNTVSGPEKFQLELTGFDLTEADYSKKIVRIKDYIAAGDAYQINFTGKYRFGFEGSTLALYKELKRKQPVSYSAFINDGERDILCFSPELFFKTRAGEITARPMKGTAPRGRTPAEDAEISLWLRQDEKSRAENLMIVDLIRNDLGRLAEIGSVKAPELFTVESYRTLLQMTSTVTGRLKPDTGYYEIFKALFPCGSVTGAPKVRTMRLIAELEAGPRGIYTGAIGYFGPAKESVFNVAIRTLVIEGRQGEMGTGSGIVFDSDPASEYAECALKTRFLTEPAVSFRILESVLWEKGYRFLDRHLKRLKDSADYFEYPLDLDFLSKRLQENGSLLRSGKRYKVRLELDSRGTVTIENRELAELAAISAADAPLRVMISTVRTDSTDRFLYHKTTHRRLYDAEYQKATALGYADVLFVNENGQLTEGAISNVFIVKDGCWYTPPMECGLLRGVYRSYLLDQNPQIKEAILKIKDLETADAIYICNSIRGLRRVSL
jgi:para-aminobenzoate synthetase/4-amino-4-deoxychorismate lyase